MKTMSEMAASPLAFVEDLQIPTRFGVRRCGDVMQPYQRERLDWLCPDLLALAAGQKPPGGRHWWETAKGTSKTSDAAAAILWLCVFASRPLAMVSGAVDRDNAAELQKACKAIVAENPWLQSVIDVQSWAIVGRQSGAICEIEAADQKGSSGARPAFCHIDECGHVPDDRWPYIENWLDNAAKVSGVVLASTNAGWTGTRAYDLRELVRTSRRWRFHQWAKPSPLMDQAEVDEAKLRNSPSRFQRLYFGVWGPKDEGDALNPADREACITLAGHSDRLPAGFGFAVIGVDAGLKHDRTGVAVVAIDTKTTKVCLMETRSWRAPIGGEVQLAEVETYIADAARRFRAVRIVADPWALQGTIQKFRLQGLPIAPIFPTPANADLLAVRIVAAFRERQLALYPDAELLEDLGKFSIIERNAAGFGQTYKLVAPRDSAGHADLGQAYLMAATQALMFADNLRSYRAAEAAEAKDRQQNDGRDPTWGLPVDQVDRPFDMRAEFPRGGRR